VEVAFMSVLVNQLIEKIIVEAGAGNAFVGKIFATPVETVIRIVTGERDENTVK
jgi:nitrogen regulatory protein PII